MFLVSWLLDPDNQTKIVLFNACESHLEALFKTQIAVLGPGTLGRPRGIGWRGRWEGGPGWGISVNPWLSHFNV